MNDHPDTKPAYVVAKKNRHGGWRHYWQPSADLRALGWVGLRLPAQPYRDRPGPAWAAAAKINAALPVARPGRPAADFRLDDVIERYRASPRFTRLAVKTRANYAWCLGCLSDWKGGEPVANITRAQVQGYYLARWRGAPAAATAAVRVLRLVLQFALNAGMVTHNAAQRPGLIDLDPRLRVWSETEIAVMVAYCDLAGRPSIGDAVLLGLYTGQRQGDILALLSAQYVAGRLVLRQSKRRATVSVTAHPALAARLARPDRPDTPSLIASEATGGAYASDHFRHLFARLRAGAAAQTAAPCPSLATAQFSDLRDTAVTRLATAGATVPQIAAITGHNERSVYTVLKHYLALTDEMADAAIAKLVAHDRRSA